MRMPWAHGIALFLANADDSGPKTAAGCDWLNGVAVDFANRQISCRNATNGNHWLLAFSEMGAGAALNLRTRRSVLLIF